NAHFVFQKPVSLGFSDDDERTAPCGGFDASNRSTGVTNWPVGGGSIRILTTHLDVTWTYSAALSSDLLTWVPLTPVLHQTGVGSFYKPIIPGINAILQVTQTGPDGVLYQCATIKIVASGPAAIPDGCTNSTGVAANWESASSSSAASSSSLTSTSSTSTSATVGATSSTTASTTSAGSSASATKTLASNSTELRRLQPHRHNLLEQPITIWRLA
ncbi:hypothetical protein BDZ45DRAFT_615896, partial [Acephala macrosclerotiorum]